MSVNRRFILCIVFIREVHPVDSLHNSDFTYKRHTGESMDLTVSTFTHFQHSAYIHLCLVRLVNEHDDVNALSLIIKLLTGIGRAKGRALGVQILSFHVVFGKKFQK